ncbi:MAG: bifunctional acetate--CoA ligase family protein/GNAT family N-acetyltransferase [Casimicrobiaceae bacterium]
MSVRNLEKLFRPRSVALIGASDRPGSIGAVVMRNLLACGFAGPIYPVNPSHATVAGRHSYASVAGIDEAPDLALIATPPATIPQIVSELGERGTKAAIVLTAGLSGLRDSGGRNLEQAMLDAARPHLLRILGPNCLGLLVPPLALNASFAHVDALAGSVAFVSQSGALTTALLDWARSSGIGFSHFISLGEAADVDFGDILDYLSSDPATSAILLYIESIRDTRKFMSAARAASRNLPVIAVKAGRVPEGAKAAASHTGALAGADDVYDAALARAGVLRVDTTLDLFDAAETLAHASRYAGERVVIVTNGGGPGVMATDALIAGGGRLASLSAQTLERLDKNLPATWSRANPVDIIGDAPVERYIEALDALLADPAADAVLFIHAPTAVVSSQAIAQACAPVIAASNRMLLACWLGGDGLDAARAVFTASGIPVYLTPEAAVGAFLDIAKFFRIQRLSAETPPSIPEQFEPDLATVRGIVAQALARGSALLSEPESKGVLAAYRIPVVDTGIVESVEALRDAAIAIGLPAALKILSPDISHKSDVGGVALNLETAEDVEAAGRAMLARVQKLRPDAAIAGFTLQPMIRRSGAHELIVGATTDPAFGPVILFGQGGTAVEVIGDRAIALPPLNMKLARELVGRTRVSKLLAGYRDRPAADRGAIDLTLVKIAQLVADIPEIVELDINPLLADAAGVIALDARIKVAATSTRGSARLAILPYPSDLEERVEIGGQPVLLRPTRPEDQTAHVAFLVRTDADAIRTRFIHPVRAFAHPNLASLTQIDYNRQMAFIATSTRADARDSILGIVRAVADPDNDSAEFAILVRSDLKGHGLGFTLMGKMIRYCRSRGTRELWGDVIADNAAMLELATTLGFRVAAPEQGLVRLTLTL